MSTTLKVQRWREHRDSYRPARETINPRRFGVDGLLELDAKRFVETHHYSAKYVASRFRAGLYRSRGHERAQLVGVAVFSVPGNQRVIPSKTGLPPELGCALGRFVLLDDVKANGETWFLSRAFKLLHQAKPELDTVIAYSDPVPRAKADGTFVMPGHVGTIYQAFNAHYVGRSSPRTLHLDPEGRAVHGRALTKIRKGTQGCDYAARDLIEMGAPRRRKGESGEDWVKRALREGPFTTIRHPGNHCYAWPLHRRAHLDCPDGGDYPKLRDWPEEDGQLSIL